MFLAERDQRLDWLIQVGIVLITGAAFSPVLSNQFVNIDDQVNLLANPHYRGLGWSQLQWMFTTLHNSLYRPLTWVTFAIDYLFWGVQPQGYHLTSLLFHCVNAVLVYRLAMRLLSLAEPNEPAQYDFGLRVGATAAALVFGVHPLRVEVVAWASARNDVVAGLFAIMTILCYLRAVRVGSLSVGRTWMGLTLFVYGLSLLAKPIGITLPFVLAVLDVYPLQRLGGGSGKWFGSSARRIWYEKLPFLSLAIGAGILALVAKEQSKLLVDWSDYGLIDRLAQSVYSVTFYLWKSLVPLALSPLYELPAQLDFSGWAFLLSGAVIGVSTIGLFIVRRTWPAGMASWLVYLILLAPVSGIVQNGPQIAADRYSYLSCLPLAILAGFAVRRSWLARLRGSIGELGFVMTGATAGLIILSFAVLTWRQAEVWRDAETLWRHALVIDENSFFANQFLGLALFEQRKTEEALVHFRRALAINPKRASAHNNMGLAQAELGDTDEAIKSYRHAVAIDPESAKAHFNLARLLALQGLEAEAMEHYRRVIEIIPDHVDAHNDLGLLLEMKGEDAAALGEFRQALRLEPDHPRALFNLAELLAKQGDLTSATAHYEKAARLEPTEPAIQIRLAIVLARQGQLELATQHFRRAVELKPADADARVLLARSLAAQGKQDEAERYYQEALRLTRAAGNTAGTPALSLK